MTEKETIVIIGAGVIGLTTALTIQQHLPHNKTILLIARELPQDTSINYASPWAGAHYRPVPWLSSPTSPSSQQLTREATQARYTYTKLKTLATQEPASGVKVVEGIEYLESPPEEYLDPSSIENAYSHLDGFRDLPQKTSSGDDDSELPVGVKWGAQYETLVINSPVYCAYLLRKFVLRGGEVRRYGLVDAMEGFQVESCSGGNTTTTATSKVRTVVNCSGLGFGDPKSFIIRGQTCLVRNPVSATITRQNTDGTWSFCIPRPLDGGTVIGGTKQPHNWDPNPSKDTRRQLLINAAKWFPFTAESNGEFDVIGDIVGRRPARKGGMRIEVERVPGGVGGSTSTSTSGDTKGATIVHAYGAGGRGFELSWGVAEDVRGLMIREGLLDGPEYRKESL